MNPKHSHTEEELRLLRLYRDAIDLLRTPKCASEWLVEPNARLRGTMPIQALLSEEQTAEVEAFAGRLQHGVY